MTRIAVPILFVAGSAAAMSSTNYSSEPVVNDEGGGPRAAANYRTHVSIGKDVAGLAASTNYRNELGLIVPEVGAGDFTAPGEVTGFTATAAGDAQVDLSWTNPGDADVAGAVIFRRQGAAPTFTPTDGTSYTAGTTYGDSVCAHSGAGTLADDLGLSPATPYFYAAYAFDGVPNYSTATSANATTLAETVPGTSPASGGWYGGGCMAGGGSGAWPGLLIALALLLRRKRS